MRDSAAEPGRASYRALAAAIGPVYNPTEIEGPRRGLIPLASGSRHLFEDTHSGDHWTHVPLAPQLCRVTAVSAMQCVWKGRGAITEDFENRLVFACRIAMFLTQASCRSAGHWQHIGATVMELISRVNGNL
jgi:hypothetical protein